ncbi:hypothetical protein ACWGJ9_10385 [Curtobacterium citreum]
MTDDPHELIIGHPHSQKSVTQAAEVSKALFVGKQVFVVDPKGGRDRAKGEESHRRPIVLDEGWQFMPKPDNPAWLLSRYRRPAPIVQTIADFGDEGYPSRFLQPLPGDVTAGDQQPA